MQNEKEKKEPTLEELYRTFLKEMDRSYDSEYDDDDDGCTCD